MFSLIKNPFYFYFSINIASETSKDDWNCIAVKNKAIQSNNLHLVSGIPARPVIVMFNYVAL